MSRHFSSRERRRPTLPVLDRFGETAVRRAYILLLPAAARCRSFRLDIRLRLIGRRLLIVQHLPRRRIRWWRRYIRGHGAGVRRFRNTAATLLLRQFA